ncbi:hypothetical protein BV901_10250 [Serratia nematodiphila]|nr:hypothetical protein BV901_10250 [Serratia nematodiphila]
MTNDFLTLSDSIKSKLTINDKPLGFVFDADEGDNKFTLKSTLSLNGKLVAGEFENMSVMIVSYQ